MTYGKLYHNALKYEEDMTFNIHQKGFTLIETLIGATVFVLVALSAYQAFGLLMDTVSISKAKIAATSIANENFEIIRNLPYEDVGIPNGIPEGEIPRDKTTTRDGYVFDILTTIRNIDDPFDGTVGGTPSDNLSPADYKLVDLDITCTNCKVSSPLKFVTIVAPHALETLSINGALFVRVSDSNGLPIQGASVHIENTEIVPNIIIDETTDNDGWIKIVDAPPGTNVYNIIATKAGFSTDQTYPIGGEAGTDPISPDVTVVVQQVSSRNFTIDKLSSLTISSVDSTCVALPNIGFSLTGTKIIGTPSILKYDTHDFSTDGSGNTTISDLEPDTYNTTLVSSSYDLAGMDPSPLFNLSPEENKALQLVVIPHLDKALLISVKDSTNLPIDGASVLLEKTGFSETKNTNSGLCSTPGQVFWNGLSDGTYTLTISKEGYQTSISSVEISSNWQNQNIILIP